MHYFFILCHNKRWASGRHNNFISPFCLKWNKWKARNVDQSLYFIKEWYAEKCGEVKFILFRWKNIHQFKSQFFSHNNTLCINIYIFSLCFHLNSAMVFYIIKDREITHFSVQKCQALIDIFDFMYTHFAAIWFSNFLSRNNLEKFKQFHSISQIHKKVFDLQFCLCEWIKKLRKMNKKKMSEREREIS